MRQETKLLRKHLYKEFPDKKFSIRLVQPHNYASNSDVIKIKTDAPYADVRRSIEKVAKGVVIYPKGSCASSHGTMTSNICGVDDTMVEFIEIESAAK